MAYKLKKYDVAGFDLIGYRQADGKIKLGMNDPGTIMDDFPEQAEFGGVVYALEDRKIGKDGIEWGMYA